MIKPPKQSIQRIVEKIGGIIEKAKSWSQERLIRALNPIIVGWTNYHKHVVFKMFLPEWILLSGECSGIG